MTDYDYIIVGGGSAGCVLADRLFEDQGMHVCCWKRGPPDDSMWIDIPAGFMKLLNNPRYNWRFPTEPEPRLYGRTIPAPRGKTLGRIEFGQRHGLRARQSLARRRCIDHADDDACDLRARVKRLTRVRSPAKHIELHRKGIRAVEGIMLSKNLWDKSVSRVELDQRARDARLRLDQIERLVVPSTAEMSGSFGPRSITPSTSSKSKR
jgi:hypothetical protein